MYAIRMENITKRFGNVVANDNVSFAAAPGEIHCLLGENGAGKSTLMRILFGLYRQDSGSIYINDNPVTISGPRDAISLGIGMVHQHFMLAEQLTVTENIVAGCEPRKNGLLDYEKARQDILEVSERYGLRVDPDAKVEDISVGQQQRVEIIKALMRGAEVLILDEPTAVLTPPEVSELFTVMRALSESGTTIIFITHKLKETMEISHSVTVLRDGKKVGTVSTEDATPESLVEMMVGRSLPVHDDCRMPPREAIALELKDISVSGRKGSRARLDNVNLDVRFGEILGIAGVDGNGQLELEEVVCGLRRPSKGRIIMSGQDLTGLDTRRIRDKGVAYIPSDRLRRGMVGSLSLSRNSVLGMHHHSYFSQRGVLLEDIIEKHAEEIIKKYDVRAESVHQPMGSLSGGNQQKMVVGRELTRPHSVVIACQPTRGLDVGAAYYIREQILDSRNKGKAVLLISAELDEILELSDRIAIIYEGQVVDVRPTGQFTERELGLLMTGERNGV
ncbi:MAG TPA: ABC transporter ATP-binding protein [Bacillota bacterium]|nr:ABC transporter ATP-binding protein [Bacillota bacterium]